MFDKKAIEQQNVTAESAMVSIAGASNINQDDDDENQSNPGRLMPEDESDDESQHYEFEDESDDKCQCYECGDGETLEKQLVKTGV